MCSKLTSLKSLPQIKIQHYHVGHQQRQQLIVIEIRGSVVMSMASLA
jgi:hypothetical protein